MIDKRTKIIDSMCEFANSQDKNNDQRETTFLVLILILTFVEAVFIHLNTATNYLNYLGKLGYLSNLISAYSIIIFCFVFERKEYEYIEKNIDILRKEWIGNSLDSLLLTDKKKKDFAHNIADKMYNEINTIIGQGQSDTLIRLGVYALLVMTILQAH